MGSLPPPRVSAVVQVGCRVWLSSSLARVTQQLTTFIVDHGLVAVFLVMAIDAILPAGGELVMLFAGALAAGAIAGHHGPSLAAVVLAGTFGYLSGSLAGWGIGRIGERA